MTRSHTPSCAFSIETRQIHALSFSRIPECTGTRWLWHSAHHCECERPLADPVASVLFSCGRRLDDAQEDREARDLSVKVLETTPRKALPLGHCVWDMTSRSWFPAVYTLVWKAVRNDPLSIELFSDLRALFHPNGKKVLPDSVELTPPWFASMYVDDGSLSNGHTALFTCNDFNDVASDVLLFGH